MQAVSLKALLEAGCHFGHKVERWHPKARTFIYQSRDGIHIIDLLQTKKALDGACEFLKNLGREGKIVLFVGTKRQAKGVVTEEAKRVGAWYLTHRWVGGFLTNWDEVKKNLDKLNSMRTSRDTGGWDKFPKHEQVKMSKTIAKLERFYGGVSDARRLPDALFIVDIHKEKGAVSEGTRREIPMIGIVDTNSDPSKVTYPIPANDDGMGSVRLLVTAIAAAYGEGRDQRVKDEAVRKAREEAQNSQKQKIALAAKEKQTAQPAKKTQETIKVVIPEKKAEKPRQSVETERKADTPLVEKAKKSTPKKAENKEKVVKQEEAA